MRDREELIAWDQKYCQHYEPRDKKCSAGIVYDDQFPERPTACWKGGGKSDEHQLSRCPKWLRRNREQGEARADDLVTALQRMTVIGPAIIAWREKPPTGKQEVIECPVCKGRLHLSQAACNGHVHGKCETKDCVSWME